MVIHPVHNRLAWGRSTEVRRPSQILTTAGQVRWAPARAFGDGSVEELFHQQTSGLDPLNRISIQFSLY